MTDDDAIWLCQRASSRLCCCCSSIIGYQWYKYMILNVLVGVQVLLGVVYVDKPSYIRLGIEVV